MTACSEMLPVNRNWRIALRSILSQCWGCDAHGCNRSAKDQLCDICHDLRVGKQGDGYLCAEDFTLS